MLDVGHWFRKAEQTPPPAFLIALDVQNITDETNVPNPLKNDLATMDSLEPTPVQPAPLPEPKPEPKPEPEVKEIPKPEPEPEPKQEPQKDPLPGELNDLVTNESESQDQPEEPKETDSDSIFEDIKEFLTPDVEDKNEDAPAEQIKEESKDVDPIEEIIAEEKKAEAARSEDKPKPLFVPKPKPKELAEISLKKKKDKAMKKAGGKKNESLEDIFKDAASQPAAMSGGKSSSGELSISEKDAILLHMRRCWVFPAGARDAKNLIVDMELELSPEAIVESAKIVDQERMNNDSFFRTAAESALRAVISPGCNKLPLNPNNYEKWKKLELKFNPKDMF